MALLTLVLDGSSHEPTAGIMVAHEMVHVLGRWSFMSECQQLLALVVLYICKASSSNKYKLYCIWSAAF